MPPKASILIPVFNGEKYLENCLNSIYQSKRIHECEIIIVDDGSTDNTKRILKKYTKTFNNITVYSQKNQGIEAALNNGLQKCNSELILRMDADDEFMPCRIDKQIKILDNNRELSWISSAAFLMDSEGKQLVKTWAPNSKKILDCLDNHNFIIHPTVAFRKSAITSVGSYQKTTKFHEDVDLWRRLKDAKKKYLYISEPMIKYRISTSSIRLNNKQDAYMKLCKNLIYYGARFQAIKKIRHLSFKYKLRILIMIFFPTIFWKKRMLRKI